MYNSFPQDDTSGNKISTQHILHLHVITAFSDADNWPSHCYAYNAIHDMQVWYHPMLSSDLIMLTDGLPPDPGVSCRAFKEVTCMQVSHLCCWMLRPFAHCSLLSHAPCHIANACLLMYTICISYSLECLHTALCAVHCPVLQGHYLGPVHT